jgi:hypothetical protein
MARRGGRLSVLTRIVGSVKSHHGGRPIMPSQGVDSLSQCAARADPLAGDIDIIEKYLAAFRVCWFEHNQSAMPLRCKRTNQPVKCLSRHMPHTRCTPHLSPPQLHSVSGKRGSCTQSCNGDRVASLLKLKDVDRVVPRLKFFEPSRPAGTLIQLQPKSLCDHANRWLIRNAVSVR